MRSDRTRDRMRLPVFLGAGAITTGMMLLGGLAATELNPVPVVNVDAMEVDGASILSAPLPQVSPRPQLVVKVSRPLRAGDWRLRMDGQAVDLSAGSAPMLLRVSLPGPLALSSRHTIGLSAGGVRSPAGFQVGGPPSARR